MVMRKLVWYTGIILDLFAAYALGHVALPNQRE
jgi:hypothetical protein